MKRSAAVLIATVGLLAVPAAATAATITPSITADDYTAAPDGSCSLREAVQAASDNAAFSTCPAGDAGLDTIVLTSPAATPYTLTLGADDEDANAQGDLDYEDGGPLVIRSGAASVIRATVTDRVIDLGSGGNLTLENLTLDDGDVTAVALDDDSRGGNLRAEGNNSLALRGVTVRDGTARDGGGGVYASTGTTLAVSDSAILSNTVEGASGGSSGGGIFILGSTQAVIARTAIENNDIITAELGNMKGGGIRASVDDGAVLDINDSVIEDNQITHTGVQGADQVFGGGASIASQGTIRRSLISENGATAAGNVERGGGLHTDGGAAGETLNVVNSTIYDNEIGDAGNDGEGGGAYLGGNIAVAFNHSTFSSNSATGSAAGNDLHRGASSTAPVTIRANLIVSGLLFPNPCDGLAITSAGFNVMTANDTDCGFTAADKEVNTAGIVPGGPQANGGSVETIGILLTSPARDFVPAAQCFAEGTDARGFPRPLPVGGACDAGAYELHTCDGVNVSGGTYFPCAIPAGPVATPPVVTPAAKKCKKAKKKKGRAGAAAKKKKKGCKRKRRKK